MLQDALFQKIDIFVSAGRDHYRIPSICASDEGLVLCFANRRIHSVSDSAEEVHLVLRPGIDGVIIKKGFSQATFLPQVWEQLPDKKEFLTHLCLKAGLDGSEWTRAELEVSTYQVQAFEEH